MNRHRLFFSGATFLSATIVFGPAWGQDRRPQVPETVAASKAPQAMGIANGGPCKQSWDATLAAFKRGEDEAALAHVTRGLAQCPTDPALLEMRGLMLFAAGDYHEASAVINRVLAVGPGWNWTTVHDLYPSVDAYTKHLRALEAHAKKHPDDGHARFLLAYHYKVDGYPDAAVRELQMVVRLEAYNPVAVDLLKKLSKPTNGTPTKTGSVVR